MQNLSLSAASGLVKVQQSFFIVADDELSLLEITSDRQEIRHVLFSGELPEEYKARKKLKPDLESLFVDGETVVAVPSFSKPQRMRGATFNTRTKKSELLDLSQLQRALDRAFKDVNIEGAVLKDGDVHLFQRGNGPQRENAVIVVNRELSEVKKITPVALGEQNGHPLGFTDACLHQGVLYVLAVAEDTDSTYDDGAFKGAILGTLSDDGKLLSTQVLPIEHKPEGLWIEGNSVFIVTDADSRAVPAQLREYLLQDGRIRLP